MLEIYKTTIRDHGDIAVIQSLLFEHFSDCFFEVDRKSSEIYILMETEQTVSDSLKQLIRLNGFPCKDVSNFQS